MLSNSILFEKPTRFIYHMSRCTFALTNRITKWFQYQVSWKYPLSKPGKHVQQVPQPT